MPTAQLWFYSIVFCILRWHWQVHFKSFFMDYAFWTATGFLAFSDNLFKIQKSLHPMVPQKWQQCILYCIKPGDNKRLRKKPNLPLAFPSSGQDQLGSAHRWRWSCSPPQTRSRTPCCPPPSPYWGGGGTGAELLDKVFIILYSILCWARDNTAATTSISKPSSSLNNISSSS